MHPAFDPPLHRLLFRRPVPLLQQLPSDGCCCFQAEVREGLTDLSRFVSGAHFASVIAFNDPFRKEWIIFFLFAYFLVFSCIFCTVFLLWACCWGAHPFFSVLIPCNPFSICLKRKKKKKLIRKTWFRFPFSFL